MPEQSSTTNGALRTGAGVVDGLSHQFLAGSGIALQEHGGIGFGDAVHKLQHPLEGRRAPDKPLRLRQTLAAGISSSFSTKCVISPPAFLTGERSMLSYSSPPEPKCKWTARSRWPEAGFAPAGTLRLPDRRVLCSGATPRNRSFPALGRSGRTFPR